MGLADACIGLESQAEVSPAQVLPKAKEAVLKALQMDERIPEAHAFLGHIQASHDWDWPAAEREFRRDIELNPNSVEARSWYALLLSHVGRPEEALDQIQRIRILDPISPAMAGMQARIYYFHRQYDRTIDYCQTILAVAPDAGQYFQFWLGRAYAEKGRLPEAIAALEKSRELDKNSGQGFGMLATAYVRAGRRSDALELLHEAMEMSKKRYVSPVSTALVYAGLGENDRAFEWLDKAFAVHDHSLASLKVEPAYDSLRSDPRFRALLRRVHLE